jgi:WD40 repeat protein
VLSEIAFISHALAWNLASGRRQRVLAGHTYMVEAVAVSADGTRAIGSSDDSTVQLWDIDSGQQMDRWDAENGITSIGGSQHLLRVVAGDAAGQVHILALGDERVGAAGAAPDSGHAPAPDRSGRRRRRSLAEIVGFRR